MKTVSRFAIALSLLLLAGRVALAGPRVDVVIGPEPPPLVRLAAEEFAGQWQRLFDAEVVISDALPDQSDNLILLGNPETNPALAEITGAGWPELTEQGLLLRSVTFNEGERSALLVGGGRPVATLWAVYELGYRLGVRYLLSGDFYPPQPPELNLTGYDIVLEPSLQTRAWRLLDGGPTGNESWGLADQQRLLRQLAKLKFNRAILVFAPDGPWVDFEFQGVKRSTARLFGGQKFDVSGDTPGRRVFKGAKEFTNSDFAGKTSYEEVTTAGIALAKGIIDTAHELGMSAGIELEPLLFTAEFREVLPEAVDSNRGDVFLSVEPSLRRPKSFSDAIGTALRAQIDAYLGTYPIESIYFAGVPPGHRSAAERAIKVRPLASAAVARVKVAFLELDAVIPVRPAIAAWRSSYWLSLGGENVLPHLHLRRSDAPLAKLRAKGGSGFAVETWAIGDLDLAVNNTSRAAMDPAATSETACADLFTPICGSADVTGRLALGFELLEQAGDSVNSTEAVFGYPFGGFGVLLPDYERYKPHPEEVKKTLDLYIAATNEMFRAHDNCYPAARPIIYYHCKRGEFAIHFLTAVDALGQAAEAREKGDKAERIKQIEAAIESLYNAATAMSEVARDPSDRGLIAVLAAYGYRPLQELLAAEQGE